MPKPLANGPVVIIVMGVAGVGKTTIGRLLAGRLNWTFLDADDYHPEINVAKMRSGVALTDVDRHAWLDRLHNEIAAHVSSGDPAVLACSALKANYRRKLRNGLEGVVFVYLRAPRKVVEDRLEDRVGHFFNSDLLASQFEALEEPDDAIVVDAYAPADAIVDTIVETLQRMDEKAR